MLNIYFNYSFLFIELYFFSLNYFSYFCILILRGENSLQKIFSSLENVYEHIKKYAVEPDSF